MKVNGIEIELCECCEYCNNLKNCMESNSDLVWCQKDFGDNDKECHRNCRNCMESYEE